MCSVDGLIELEALDIPFWGWVVVVVWLVGSSEVCFSGLVVMAVVIGVGNSYVRLLGLAVVLVKATRSDSEISKVRL
jgi:predicted permease